jgi:hypothetical protein
MSAPSPSLQDRPPHGLWSLWDMLEFYLPDLINTSKELGRLSEVFTNAENETLATAQQNNNKAFFDAKANGFKALGLEMCSLQSARIAESVKEPLVDLSIMLKDLAQRL